MKYHALILIALAAGAGWGAQPPIVGQPTDFTGAIGGPFVVTASVEPRTMALEQPFILSLRIVGPGNLKDIARPQLTKPDAFQSFAIDNLDDAFADGSPPSRTFRYRLRARTADATRIPPFKFVYFNPAIVPASRGYQTTFAEAVPIQVTAAPPTAATPMDLPQRIAELRKRLSTRPSNEEVRSQLSALREDVRYPSDDMRPRESSWPVLHWTIAFGLAVIAGAAWIRWWKARRPMELIGAIVATSVAVVPAIGTIVQWRDRARNEETPVVVVAHETALRRGNGDEYPPRIEAPLPPGAEVRRLYERNGWLQVELANSVVGWVASDAVVQ
jgi:hypothetical protein